IPEALGRIGGQPNHARDGWRAHFCSVPATDLRCTLRQDRPQMVAHLVRPDGNYFHDTFALRAARNKKRVDGFSLDLRGMDDRCRLHVDQRSGESGTVSNRGSCDWRWFAVCDHGFYLWWDHGIHSTVVQIDRPRNLVLLLLDRCYCMLLACLCDDAR